MIDLHFTRILDALKVDIDTCVEDPLTLSVITMHNNCCYGVVSFGALHVEVEPALALILNHVVVDDARSVTRGIRGICCIACRYEQTANKVSPSTFEVSLHELTSLGPHKLCNYNKEVL